MAFGRELAEARRAHAYQAHAVHDPDAQRELADVAAAIALNDGMLASILAPAADAPRAFHPRCLFAIAARARQTGRLAGTSGTRVRE
jgi:hypothetical protein